uniref:Uncharacterized protein n=1 Tax=Timema tahoe TaxID=61484 RepID=A0A7R9IRJ4_9NEOP|nr:unnamed protein product [Timema tahoe]
MKSMWDGFLPIKEQIKEESDTSNCVHEIVKTEIKLYDSSLGIMDLNKDYLTPVDKSEGGNVELKVVLRRLRQEDIVLHKEVEGNVELKIVLRWLRKEDIVLHMEEDGNVELKIVISLQRKEDIVFHKEGERDVKLKIVLSQLNQEDIVLHMEEDGNVEPKIVLSLLRKEDIVLHMEEGGNVEPKIVLSWLRKEDIVLHMEDGNVKPKIVLRQLNQEDIVCHMEEEGYLPSQKNSVAASRRSINFVVLSGAFFNRTRYFLRSCSKPTTLIYLEDLEKVLRVQGFFRGAVFLLVLPGKILDNPTECLVCFFAVEKFFEYLELRKFDLDEEPLQTIREDRSLDMESWRDRGELQHPQRPHGRIPVSFEFGDSVVCKSFPAIDKLSAKLAYKWSGPWVYRQILNNRPCAAKRDIRSVFSSLGSCQPPQSNVPWLDEGSQKSTKQMDPVFWKQQEPTSVDQVAKRWQEYYVPGSLRYGEIFFKG